MEKELLSEKQIRRRVLWDKITFVLIAIFLALSAVFSITLIYQKTYFEVKWVNGQSMYPTFNKDAVDRYGNPKGKEGGSANNGDKELDCVIWDKHESTMSKMERFDIVIASQNGNSNRDLIKRVIAFPGESFYFGVGEDNGSLYIQNDSGEFVYTPQPIGDEYIKEGTYYGEFSYYKKQQVITLKDNEYFICGDNRGFSSDSRSFGPVTKEHVYGIVVAVVGKADAGLDDQNNKIYKNLRIGWPRWIK